MENSLVQVRIIANRVNDNNLLIILADNMEKRETFESC